MEIIHSSASGIKEGDSRNLQSSVSHSATQATRLVPVDIENWTSSLVVYPNRWGIITSLRLWRKEILYQGMLDSTLSDFSKSVKWGIPILFPNAGPLSPKEKEESWYTLPQHGFARSTPWKITESTQSSITQVLSASDVVEMYGFQWMGTMRNQAILSENSCEFLYRITNDGDEDLPISWWLHPYFSVPEWDKWAIRWDFEWGEQVAREVEKWSNDGTTMIDMPDDRILRVFIPGIGNLQIETSSDFQKLWIWSLPGKNFVCIEPVMGNPGNIVKNPIFVGIGSIHESSMKITISQ